MNPLELVNKLAEQENGALQVLAPFNLGTREITVRILGIVTRLRIENRPSESGWFMFTKTGPRTCRYTGAAPRGLLQKHLELFPEARFVYLGQFNGIDFGLQESAGSGGLMTEGPVALRFVDNVSEFDSIVARFDGHNFYFQGRNRRRPGQSAGELRTALGYEASLENLHIRHLLGAERTAYKMLLEKKLQSKLMSTNANLDTAKRAELALGVAGVKLGSIANQAGGTSRVTFELNGTQHNVVIRTDNLQVVNSGVCLAGRDSDFDLTSLVSVFNSRNNGRGYAPGDRNEHGDPAWDEDD